jgi:TonB-dependent starch-binding outer membrane protein SusC
MQGTEKRNSKPFEGFEPSKGLTKLVKIMKITAGQLLILALFTNASLARVTNAQVLDRKVSVQFEKEKLQDALAQLEKKAEVKFVYSASVLALTESVSLTVSEEKLGDVLGLILGPLSVLYVVKNNSYIVLKRAGEKDTGAGEPYGALLPEAPLLATITGTVTDAATQQPLPGVNIIIKGTTKGTTSDADGKFALDADGTDILIFSFIGFKSVETPVGDRTVIDVTMEGDVKALGEVVINAGYWNVTDRERTGNIAKVTAEEIQRQPISNPLQALQGRMPGVTITQLSGVPGGGFTVRIRGQNSLRNQVGDNGNEPFYIVDGVPFTATLPNLSQNALNQSPSPLNSINPADIESIEVLKDADATAIYGSRGANGVVLITTKKGKSGKTKVEFNLYSGAGIVPQRMELLNSQQYTQMRIEGHKNDKLWPLTPALQVSRPDIFLWDTTRYTDWQKELIGGTARTTSANFSVSGGAGKTQFLVGGGYYKEGTVFPGDFAYQRGSAHVNMNHASENDKIKISLSASFLADVNNLPAVDFTRSALTLPPSAPAGYNDNGLLNWSWGTGFTNPFPSLEQKFKGNTSNLVANSIVGYQPIKGLQFRTSLGYNDLNIRRLSISPIKSKNPSVLNTTGGSNFDYINTKGWIVEPQIEYERTINKGKLNILSGITFQQNVQETLSLAAGGYTNDALIENLRAAPTVRVNGSSYTEYRYSAWFARINYNWRDKYIVNLTGRRDGSSRFGPGKRFNNLGAVGLAWLFTNEGFAQNLSFLSFGKLRASYGTTGSDAIGNYGYLDTYSPASNNYNTVASLIPTRLANPDYSWETTKKFEGGLELRFARDRIFFGISWFRNTSSNQLAGFDLPVITGFTSIQYNLPATVENTGWEFELTTTNIKSNNITWSTAVNLTIPRNRLVEYPDLKTSPYASQYEIGRSLYLASGWRSTGVDPQTGLYSFEDVNGNGSGTDFPDEWRGLESITQNFYGGLQNNINYKGLQLDFLFQFVKQTGRNYIYFFNVPGGSNSNQPVIVMDRWRNPGDITDIQRFGASSTYNSAASSDLAIGDASFVRLKNVSLSYQLPSQWTEKMRVNARVYIQGQNLLTITDYLGLDPEIQNFSLPPLRMLTGGIQLTL